MNLRIQHPCHENWAFMSSIEQGRFCATCQKQVFDFTTFSTSDIKLFIEQRREEFCGRFYKEQFDNFNKSYQALPTPSRMKQWATVAVLSAVVVLPSFGQEAPLPSSNSQIETTLNTTRSYQEMVTLEGRIWDSAQKKAVVAAIIVIQGTDIGTITNNNGDFSIKIPWSQEKVELTINHASYQLNNYQIVPNQSRTGLLIEIKNAAQAAETIPTPKEAAQKEKRHKKRRSSSKTVLMGCPIF